jgi:hypothetical protein
MGILRDEILDEVAELFLTASRAQGSGVACVEFAVT